MTQRPVLTIATATNYPAGSDTWSGTPTVVTPDANWGLYGQVPAEGVPAQVLNAYLADLRGGFDDAFMRRLGDWRKSASFSADNYGTAPMTQSEVVWVDRPADIGRQFFCGDAKYLHPNQTQKSGIDAVANPARLATNGTNLLASLLDGTPAQVTILSVGSTASNTSNTGGTQYCYDLTWRAATSRWVTLQANSGTGTSTDLWTSSGSSGAVTYSQLYTAATNVDTRGTTPGPRLEALPNGDLVALAGVRSGTREAVFLRYTSAGVGSMVVTTAMPAGVTTPIALKSVTLANGTTLLYALFGTSATAITYMWTSSDNGATWTGSVIPVGNFPAIDAGGAYTGETNAAPRDLTFTGRNATEAIASFTTTNCHTAISILKGGVWIPVFQTAEKNTPAALYQTADRGFLAVLSATVAYFCEL